MLSGFKLVSASLAGFTYERQSVVLLHLLALQTMPLANPAEELPRTMDQSHLSSSPSRRSPQTHGRDPFPRGARAFSLVEISVVVMIIGILATMSMPAVRKAGDAAKVSTYISDLRVFSGAFDQFAQTHGQWPDTQRSTQNFPEGMEGYLSNSAWTRFSPIGGNYSWDRDVVQNGRTITAAISLIDAADRPVFVTSAQLDEIDRKLDDGNLSTGMFQLGFNNMPIYILEGSSEPGVAPPPPPPPPPAGGGALGGGFAAALSLLVLIRVLCRPERSA